MDELTFTMSIPVLVAIAGLMWKVWKQEKDITKMSIEYTKKQRKVEDRTLVMETKFEAHDEHYDELKESIDKLFDKVDKLASEIRNGHP